ncbi:hypothetical protein DFH27DRAFT_383934 [Peziza echinospora]|nr:hypothetical protein DFH27DRAFT_383934 [Peziza echinospora]
MVSLGASFLPAAATTKATTLTSAVSSAASAGTTLATTAVGVVTGAGGAPPKAAVSTSKKYIKKGADGNTENLPVRLVLCFDGTGDTAEGSFSGKDGHKSGTKDSIYTIWDLVEPGAVTDPTGKRMYQYAQYFEGVATINSDKGGLVVQAQALFDGATGNGYLDILRKGYRVCCEQLQHTGGAEVPNHELFIYGFSRGAFIARALASFLQHVGLLKLEHIDKDPDQDKLFRESFKTLLERYMKVTSRSFFGFGTAPQASEHRSELLPMCIACPRVRVLGAFDTVKTVIPLPLHNYFKEKIPNIDFQMDAPGIVDHFRHALALNEARPLFNPDLWKQPSDSSDSSYLEAWFFGYHHDVGGGDTVQGLALWPLQWILTASKDNGLVLDPKVSPYEILFAGANNTVETPHEVVLGMYDMIKHHNEQRSTWGLKLNQPFSLMAAKPREWFAALTKPPYLTFKKPKVFVHPSAYLVFDISSSFRIQLYQWKHFRRFMEDRFQALSAKSAPWWEKQTVENILKESGGVDRLNLLVIGRPSTGKETMVTNLFGVPAGPTNKGIHSPVAIAGNDMIRIFYSNGFGKNGTDGRKEVSEFLRLYCNHPDPDERLHAIWYFHDCVNPINESEKALFKMEFGDIPLMVVLQNEDKLRESFKDPGADGGEEIDFAQDAKATTEFARALEKVMDDLKLPRRGKYVHTRNAAKAPKQLLADTACSYDNDELAIAQIKAQRLEIQPKVALATEEAVRAYTIWHTFRTTGVAHRFGRNKNPEGMNVGARLIEVVLATFSMGFEGDDEFLRERLGSPWAALDYHTKGLCDATLPGGLILLCMFDCIVTMTYTIAHRRDPTVNWKGEALSLSQEDMDRGCAWYTKPPKDRQQSPQQDLHTRVNALLNGDGTPKDGCIANLQMRAIEIIEQHAATAQAAPSVIDNAKALVTGIVGGFAGRFR